LNLESFDLKGNGGWAGGRGFTNDGSEVTESRILR